MNMLTGKDEPDSGQVVVRKDIKMAFLAQDNNLQDELTIEESIFASDNDTLKVIERYEKHCYIRKTRKPIKKLLTIWIGITHGILKHNTNKFYSN